MGYVFVLYHETASKFINLHPSQGILVNVIVSFSIFLQINGVIVRNTRIFNVQARSNVQGSIIFVSFYWASKIVFSEV